MCLLVALFDAVPGYPLVVAANRDEFLERPAVPMAILNEAGPRVLGGRDLLAGGTWLAVSEHGLFAALTNFPAPVRDPARKSRGELPLALVRHPDAAQAVAAFCKAYRPADYNPAWILVGDRRSVWYVDFTQGDFPLARPLEPGIHVLENRPLDPPSPKAAFVGAAVAALGPADLVDGLAGVLASHAVPEEFEPAPGRPAALGAACVHAGPYGTRSSTVLRLPAVGPPDLRFSEGPLCTHELRDAGPYWEAGGP